MASQRQPNILVAWPNDIGQSNLSCYTHGLMGYRTFRSEPGRRGSLASHWTKG
jgi:arylsulfatase A-like enzyme